MIARILADNMGRRLGQQIIVENRPGAGGTLGTRALAKSEPDGYTLAMGSTGTVAMAPTAYPNAGYDPHKDFAPIGLIARSAIVLVTGPSVPAKSVQELVELGRKDPESSPTDRAASAAAIIWPARCSPAWRASR